MKIACIIHSLSGGGAERVMAGLTSRLAIRGHNVTLITLDDGSGDRYDVSDQVIRCPLGVISNGGNFSSRVRNTWRRIRAVRDAIDQTAPEVVLSFCDRTNVLTLLATERRQVPVVVSERSDPSRQKLGPIWERLRRRKYKRADTVVALTDASANYLRGYLGRPVIVIPSAVDRPPMLSDRTTAQANRRIVGLGRLEHEKGFDRLLDAFSDLTVRAPKGEQDWSLRIIGEGSMRGQLESKVQQLGLSDRVSLPGWIRPVWEELSEATIFVLPSRYEGFPSALLEAMAVGVPSLSVDCQSGPRAVLTDNVNGLLVPNDLSASKQSALKQSASKQSALTSGILRMIQETETRERIGEAGKRVAHQFNWDSMVDAYERVLEGAIARKS